MPVCSQFSEESRWDLEQRSSEMWLLISVEKPGVRMRAASPRWPRGCPGRVRSKVLHPVSDPKPLLCQPAQTSLGETPPKECCCHYLPALESNEKYLPIECTLNASSLPTLPEPP